MKIEEIKNLHLNKISALEILVYFAIKELRKEDRICPKNSELSELLPGSPHQSFSRAKVSLKDKGIIGIVQYGKKTKIFFLASEKKEFEKEKFELKKEILKKQSGIYAIFFDDKVYIGQSKNVARRWNNHREQIGRNIHPHIKKNTKCEFKLLEECRIDQLYSRELLWAQRFYDKGNNISNKNNFKFIKEE